LRVGTAQVVKCDLIQEFGAKIHQELVKMRQKHAPALVWSGGPRLKHGTRE
jgi:hypothetical protein